MENDFKQFVDEVAKMRRKQNDYFARRLPDDLKQAKRLESEVDSNVNFLREMWAKENEMALPF